MRKNRDHWITHFAGIKQCKCVVILKDSPCNSAFFGLVIQWPLKKPLAIFLDSGQHRKKDGVFRVGDFHGPMVGCWIWIEMNHWWYDPCVPLNGWWVLNVSSCKWTRWFLPQKLTTRLVGLTNQPSKSGSIFLKVHCFKTWIDSCSCSPGIQSTQWKPYDTIVDYV